MKAERPSLPRVMRFKQACDESGFSYQTLRDAHFRGDLAVIKVGRAWYVEIAELARFTERNTERTTTNRADDADSPWEPRTARK